MGASPGGERVVLHQRPDLLTLCRADMIGAALQHAFQLPCAAQLQKLAQGVDPRVGREVAVALLQPDRRELGDESPALLGGRDAAGVYLAPQLRRAAADPHRALLTPWQPYCAGAPAASNGGGQGAHCRVVAASHQAVSCGPFLPQLPKAARTCDAHPQQCSGRCRQLLSS
jgi:hypothetical protein